MSKFNFREDCPYITQYQCSVHELFSRSSGQNLPNVGENHHRHSNHDRERTHTNSHDSHYSHSGYYHNVDLGASDQQNPVLLLSNESLKHCPKEPNFTYTIDLHMQQHTCQKPIWVNGKIVGGEYNEGQ